MKFKPPEGVEKRYERVKSRKNRSDVEERNCRNGAEIEMTTSAADGEDNRIKMSQATRMLR